MYNWLVVILVIILVIVLCYISTSAIKYLLSAGVLYLIYSYLFPVKADIMKSEVKEPVKTPEPVNVEPQNSDLLDSLKKQLQPIAKKTQNLSKGQMVALMERYTDDRRTIDEKMAAKTAEKSTLDQRAIINNSKKTEASLNFIWQDELTAHENRVWWEQDDNFDLRM